MAADLTQTLDALRGAVEELAQQVGTHGADSSGIWLFRATEALALVTFGLVVANVLLVWVTAKHARHAKALAEQTKEVAEGTKKAAAAASASADAARAMVGIEREREGEERRRVAGALAAELRGFVSHWGRIRPQVESRRFPLASVEGTYFSLFDNIGHRLLLLPPDLARDVVAHCVRCKASFDSVREACRLVKYWAQLPISGGPRTAGPNNNAISQTKHTIEEADVLIVSLTTDLLPRLDRVAQGPGET